MENQQITDGKPEKPKKKVSDNSLKNLKPREAIYTEETKEEIEEIVFNMLLAGATVKELAFALGLNIRTVNKWFIQYPSLGQAALRARMLANGKVVGALFKRATGFVQEEEQVVVTAGGPGISSAEVVKFKKHYAPDTKAIQLFLYNRMPEQYRDKREVEFTDRIEIEMVLTEQKNDFDDDDELDDDEDDENEVEDADYSEVNDDEEAEE